MKLYKLLTTTAIIAMTATGAYVASPSSDVAAATMAAGYVQRVDTEDHFASDIVGSTVYNSASADGEAIGDVNDLVVAPDGDIAAVVIGVGGFLGLGEKDVAVDFDRLEWRTDETGDTWPILTVTQEELEAAPAFERQEQAAAMTDQPASDLEMAMQDDPVVPPVTPDQTVMASDPDQPGQEQQIFDPSTVSAENLIDTTVYAVDGASVGEIADVLLSDSGEIDAVVIDVGGFLGIGAKPVAISYDDLEIMMDENERLIIRTAFTEDELDAAPEYDETAFRANPDRVLVHGRS